MNGSDVAITLKPRGFNNTLLLYVKKNLWSLKLNRKKLKGVSSVQTDLKVTDDVLIVRPCNLQKTP